MQCKKPRRGLPDLADAKGKDHPFKSDLAPRLDRRQKVADRHLAIAVKFCQRVSPLAKPEDIGWPLDPAELDELVDLARPQSLDIKGIARDEMLQPFETLCRAFKAVGAAPDRLALGTYGRCTAFRTAVREGKLGAVGRARLGNDAHHLRNDVTCPLDYDAVADPDVLAADFVLIVQGGVGYDNATDSDRLQPRHRSQRASAADLNVDGVEQGLGLFSGKFMGEGPSWSARHLSQALLIVVPVDLVDNAVDVIAEIRPRGTNGEVVFQEPGDIGAAVRHRIDAESHFAECAEALHMRLGKRRTGFT